ncbi:MAG: hypothetical protein LBI20_02710 [Holosporales bacterium]|jgi:hypothetical protein|nr:hypothetical protein [Holosporales bacterium]
MELLTASKSSCWSPPEITLLRKLGSDPNLVTMPSKWYYIAAQLPPHSPLGCREKYRFLVRDEPQGVRDASSPVDPIEEPGVVAPPPPLVLPILGNADGSPQDEGAGSVEPQPALGFSVEAEPDEGPAAEPNFDPFNYLDDLDDWFEVDEWDYLASLVDWNL